MLGPTDMGELSILFSELVRMLKDLPPGGFDKAYTHRNPATAATKTVSFMCDKQSFKDIVRMAELGERLAKQAHDPDRRVADPLADTIMAGFKSLKAKVDQLALDTAMLASKQATVPRTFADAAASGGPTPTTHPEPKPGVKGRKPPPPPGPTQLPPSHSDPALWRQRRLRGALIRCGRACLKGV